jgi:hypothetical protein
MLVSLRRFTARVLPSLLPVLLPAMAAAQTRPDSIAPSSRNVDTCYRFAFGSWTPALDLRWAGHDTTARPLPGAAPGRDWAAPLDAKGPATLMLYPGWWPAGVMVQLPGGPPAVGDTARGTATALVADARLRSPAATARAWGVVCGQ